MEAKRKDNRSFGEQNFGAAELGDVRRTRRLVDLADRIVQHPGGTLPQKLNDPADLVSLYRLCKNENVTHEKVIKAHFQKTLDRIVEGSGDVLVIHDGTELDYSKKKTLAKGMGQIGNGHGRGRRRVGGEGGSSDQDDRGSGDQHTQQQPGIGGTRAKLFGHEEPPEKECERMTTRPANQSASSFASIVILVFSSLEMGQPFSAASAAARKASADAPGIFPTTSR